jgi:hypothetical protein
MRRSEFRSKPIDRHRVAQPVLYAFATDIRMQRTLERNRWTRIAHRFILGERNMNARKQYGGGFAVLLSLTVVAAALVLPSCGSGGGGCAANPAGPGCQPSPSPSPALVTRVVSQGNAPMGSKFVAPVVFTTTAAGSVGITVDWTFATNDVDIFLARGSEPCTLQTFNDRSCGFIATEESFTMKPEKLTVPSLAAGTYSLYIANFGDTDESVAWQFTLTSTSASSASVATTATVQRSATKGTLNRILEPR